MNNMIESRRSIRKYDAGKPVIAVGTPAEAPACRGFFDESRLAFVE